MRFTNYKDKNFKGITLVALVVTIVILLILAGVAISIAINGGIIGKAKYSTSAYEESDEKEQLETELASLAIDKNSDSSYNSNDYLTNKLIEKGFLIDGNIVTVKVFKFEINRDTLSIVSFLGKGSQTSDIQIKLSQTVSSNFSKSTIKIEVSCAEYIKKIIFGTEELEVPLKQDDKYVLTKDVTKNDTYSVSANLANGDYAKSTIVVNELTDSYSISSVNDFTSFRDKVNSGATFEGKTITLSNDINLNEVCGDGIRNWSPIGSAVHPFKGTFDGNGHTIDNVYINSTENNQALFGTINGSTLTNLTVKGSIVGNMYIAGLVSNASGNDIIKNVNNYVSIASNSTDTNCNSYVGGILAWAINSTNLTVENCNNYGTLTSNHALNGGIVGEVFSSANVNFTIMNCNNYGSIVGNENTGGILGNVWETKNINIINCCNYGNIQNLNTYACGGILGKTTRADTVRIEKCSNLGVIEVKLFDAGGIIGFIVDSTNFNVTQCFNKGDIIANQDTSAGIISSVNNSTNINISDSYNTGNLSKNKFSGGILGIEYQDNPSVSISNCYNVGNLNVDSDKDSIIGFYVCGDKTINNCYTLEVLPSSYAITKSLNDFYQLAPSLGSNWMNDEKDLNNSWKYNNGFPILKWQANK